MYSASKKYKESTWHLTWNMVYCKEMKKYILPTIVYIVLFSLLVIVKVMDNSNNKELDLSILKQSVVEVVGKIRSGSGVLISKDGLIATNYHVIEKTKDTETRYVVFRTKKYKYSIVDTNPKLDLAVIKILLIEETKFFVELADQKESTFGDTVYAIGNPLGLNKFISKGIISKYMIKDKYKYIGTDVLTNHGSSGGGLFTENGKLLGITTYMKVQSSLEHYTGISVAYSSVYLKQYIK